MNTSDSINNIGNPQENMQMRGNDVLELVKNGVKKEYPNLTVQQTESVSKQLLAKENNGNIKVGNTEIRLGDFAYSAAMSIQRIQSETSPQEEFYRWIDDAKLVISEMTDNSITESDLKHRDAFITGLDQREIEIKTCISLYESAAMYGSPQVQKMAQKQLEFLRMKWAKLLELRSAVKNATKSRLEVALDPQVSQEEHKRGKLYLLSLQYMRRGMEIPPRLKASLEWEYDEHFNGGISAVLANRAPMKTKDDVITRINILRGRQEPSYRPQSEINKMYFLADRFRQLSRENKF